VEEYTSALNLDERSPAAYGNRSIAYLKLKFLDEAVSDAQHAVELRPLWAKWHLRLAQALRAADRHAEALVPLLRAAALEQAQIRIVPGSKVEVHGLQSNNCYNGQKAKCIRWHDDRGRWEVRMQNGPVIKVKPQNLEVLEVGANSGSNDELCKLVQAGHTVPVLDTLKFPTISTPARIPKDNIEQFREELECCLCSSLLCEPTVLSCGHCMCRDCVARLLDHALQREPSCPLCRTNLMPLLQQVNLRARAEQRAGLRFAHGAAQLTICIELARLLSEWFAQDYAERLSEVRAPQSEWVPIFVCSLSAPFIPTPLHIFEPRYRLMMRRCVESNQRFGMCLPSEDGFADTGTMLFIDRFEQLPDGRSLVGTKGVSRFHVIERNVLDGYNTALIRPYEEDTEGFPGSAAFHNQAVALNRGAQVLLQKIEQMGAIENFEHQLGLLPDVDSPQFDAHMSFYAAQVLQCLSVPISGDLADLIFLQPESERWRQLLQQCNLIPQFAEQLKELPNDQLDHIEAKRSRNASDDDPNLSNTTATDEDASLSNIK